MFRRDEREQAFIFIFERSINKDSSIEIIETAKMVEENSISDFATRILHGIENQEENVDAYISKNIRGWKINRLSKVSISLLRLAIYEFLFEEDIPYSVSINEVVNLAKKYGRAEDASFVNGVLASVVRELYKNKE